MSTPAAIVYPASHEAPRAPVQPWAATLRRALAMRGLVCGAVVLGLIILAALLTPWLAPHDPYLQDVTQRLLKPVWYDAGSWVHPLGTDKLGRDYLSRLLYGARVSILIGISAALVAGTIGTTLGVLAGYFGGRVDAVISYIITTRLAMPVILVALALSSLTGGSLQMVIVLLGLLLWDRFAMVTRAVTMQLRNADFIAAAKVLGASTPYILLRELLPNIVGPLTVIATLEMSHAILLEATLSFLGLGVQPPSPSWGLMIAEGKGYMYFQPWVIAIPACALVVLVLSINLLGDGLRDIATPDARR